MTSIDYWTLILAGASFVALLLLEIFR